MVQTMCGSSHTIFLNFKSNKSKDDVTALYSFRNFKLFNLRIRFPDRSSYHYKNIDQVSVLSHPWIADKNIHIQ